MNIEEYKALMEQEEKQEDTSQEKTPEVQKQPEVEEAKQTETPQTWEVNGQEVTIDELTKGYLRQSDYTKKTTEAAKAKKEAEEALALYEVVQKNPELREQLKANGVDEKILDKATAEHRRLADVESELAGMKLDKMLTDLKNKYPDFDETAVINEAAKRGTSDLEFVYKAIRQDKGGEENVDEKALKAELLAELKKELGLDDATPVSMIDGRASGATPTEQDGPVMTPAERKIAASFGMTDEEYIRNRDM